MLDTVKIASPDLAEDVAAVIESRLESRRAVDNRTGWIMYEITSGGLDGSFDHRMSCRVRRERPVSVVDPVGKRAVVWEASPPYVVIEGSIHKAMAGHNVAGGPNDLRLACRWFWLDLCKRLDVYLPVTDEWVVRRVDWTDVYDLGSALAVGDYLWALGGASYPRRKPPYTVPRQTVMFSGHSSALKFYHKGPEFRFHDYKRLLQAQQSPSRQWAGELQELADRLLRVECSIKSPVLDRWYGVPTVERVSSDWLAEVAERDVLKVLREGRSDMAAVRSTLDVKRRLHERYSGRQARALFATWSLLATVGEVEVRGQMNRTTFYHHRGLLVDAGVSWRGTDLQVVDAPSTIPAGFVPTRLDPRRLLGLDPRVDECLRSVAA